MSSRPTIGIAGFGMEGRAVYEYFKDRASIHIFDESAVDITGIDATFHQALRIPEDISVIFKSPGIPTSKLALASSQTRISTFMDTVLENVGARSIGITGTKGKSTVTALVHHVLKEAGKDVVLFGNIGIADATTLREDILERQYVIELSSYQCEHITHSPHIAVFTNFYPEHLSHHGSLDSYREAKLNIARFQKPEDIFINASGVATDFPGKEVSPDLSLRFETKLAGEHNQRNCAIAFAAICAAGIDEATARKHIETFEPLPYRLEKVGTYKEITFFDDSLATIPEATLASIETLGNVDTLILGGEDRGISFEEFAAALVDTSITTFIVFPDTGAKMVAKLGDRRVIPISSMEEAVRAAFAETRAGGTVLLSNASPSFNLFKDYKDKSAQYRKWIEELGGGMVAS